MDVHEKVLAKRIESIDSMYFEVIKALREENDKFYLFLIF